MISRPAPLVVIGDLHGHLDLFERQLAWIDQEVPDARIVTLGDYVDNGPQIPALLDRLIALQEARPGLFCPILGNHDLALLRALGWPHADPDPDPAWYARWASRYWNPGLGTPQAYGARDAPSFARRFPETHRRFLAALPWYHDDGEHFCVHAGLEVGPIGPQRAALEARTLPAEPTFMPAPLRDKRLALQHDPTWERVVVSSHTHLRGQPFFFAPRRVCVSATADHGGGLFAVLLPERRCWWTDGGPVTEVA